VNRLRRWYNSPFGAVARLLVGVGVLGFVFSTLDWQILRALLERVTLTQLAAVILTAVLGHGLGALRFKLLCDPVVKLPYLLHLRQYFIGAATSLFLPSGGGEGVRALLLKGSSAAGAESVSLVLLERIIGATSLACVAAAAAPFAALPSELRLALGVLASGSVGALWGLFAIASRVAGEQGFVRRMAKAVATAFSRGRLLLVLCLSIAYQVAAVLVTEVVNHTCGLGIPPPLVFALTPLVWFATMLPISVGALGVREAAFVIVFAWGSVDRERALVLSLGTYAGLLATGLVGVLWFGVDRVRSMTQRQPR